MTDDKILQLLTEIKAVTAEMVKAARDGAAAEALVSLLARRQTLMDQMQETTAGGGTVGLGQATGSKELLREVLEMDIEITRILERHREEARQALEKLQASKKGLAYIKQQSRSRQAGRLLNSRG